MSRMGRLRASWLIVRDGRRVSEGRAGPAKGQRRAREGQWAVLIKRPNRWLPMSLGAPLDPRGGGGAEELRARSGLVPGIAPLGWSQGCMPATPPARLSACPRCGHWADSLRRQGRRGATGGDRVEVAVFLARRGAGFKMLLARQVMVGGAQQCRPIAGRYSRGSVMSWSAVRCCRRKEPHAEDGAQSGTLAAIHRRRGGRHSLATKGKGSRQL